MANKIEASFYVVIAGRKQYGSWSIKADRIVKRTNSLPSLNEDEVPILVTVALPRALFERPELSVRVDVDGDVPRIHVDAETVENLEERIQEILGVPVTIEVDVPEVE